MQSKLLILHLKCLGTLTLIKISWIKKGHLKIMSESLEIIQGDILQVSPYLAPNSRHLAKYKIFGQ